MSPPLLDSAPPVRVLIVEDEAKTRRSIAEALEIEGWNVTQTTDGTDIESLLSRGVFNLVVLDWMLPGRDGLEILQRMRALNMSMPVLMLTAREGVDDRVIGLESGADDYLVKPFTVAELVARCRAMLRRPLMNLAETLRCGDLQLDTRARVAFRSGAEIALSPKEVDVLEYLLRRQGQIVTREMLERDVWKQTNRFTSLDNVIDVQIMRLRRKLDGEGLPKLIHTLRGVGYRIASGD